ncbi:transglycosylase domain-containing protein [Alteribacter populi]|uniref:transglycosylase domain-containing protein n=1 Tax=Alteribacter populi TaxID=2011011 RepID=UPI000C2C2DB7|nr:transglycosylase domain-containing protein [Alteribacter populi]
MRAATGTFCILLLMGIFSFLLIGGLTEYQKAHSLHDVLDESLPLEETALRENSRIVDRTDEVVSDLYDVENRINLSYEHIPSFVLEALVAVEDQTFFDHQGFDVQGITRALLESVLFSKKSRGTDISRNGLSHYDPEPSLFI